MEVKELIVNKPSDLFNILNRKEYTKLTLNCEVNPKLLFGFDNVKDLEIIKENPTNFSKLEEKINSYPFINNLEKLKLKNIYNIGSKPPKKSSDSKVFKLKANNLKSIEYISGLNDYCYYSHIYKDYLIYCSNLEELVLTFSNILYITDDINLPNSLKKIIIKHNDKEFIIPLEMFTFRRLNFYYDREKKTISLRIYNNMFSSIVNIDIVRNKITIDNALIKLCNSLNENLDCLYIPDFIKKIDYENINYDFSIKHISFNNNLLKKSKDYFKITDNNYLDLLETITIRYDNEMSLFPNKIIKVKEYGNLIDLYVKDNNLCLYYEDKIVRVDDNGIENIEYSKKETKQKREDTKEKLTFELDKYSINELEEYLYYRKLLENIKDSNDKELTDAVNIVGNKLVKKLNKCESYE